MAQDSTSTLTESPRAPAPWDFRGARAAGAADPAYRGTGVPPLRPGLRMEPMHLRERPAADSPPFSAGGWPAFIGPMGALAARYLPAVRATSPTSRSRSCDTAYWSRPAGVSRSAGTRPPRTSLAGTATPSAAPSRVQEAIAADTLVVCATQVRPDAVGSGLAVAVLESSIQTGRASGLSKVIAPLRPTAKHRYPSAPIEDYADGLHRRHCLDPWLRTHLRMNAQTVATSGASQTFTGTVISGRSGAVSSCPETAPTFSPTPSHPLYVDKTADVGTCTESTIWVRHR